MDSAWPHARPSHRGAAGRARATILVLRPCASLRRPSVECTRSAASCRVSAIRRSRQVDRRFSSRTSASAARRRSASAVRQRDVGADRVGAGLGLEACGRSRRPRIRPAPCRATRRAPRERPARFRSRRPWQGRSSSTLRRRDAHFRRGIGGDEAREVAGLAGSAATPAPAARVGMLVQGGTREYPGDHAGQGQIRSIEQIRRRILAGEGAACPWASRIPPRRAAEPFLAHTEGPQPLLDAVRIAPKLLAIRQPAFAARSPAAASTGRSPRTR